jgi:Tfp pilus assembly protein PilE
MNLVNLHSRPGHRALTLVQTIVVVGVAAFLVALAAGSVRTGFQLHRERAIRENLQTVWIIANQYFNITGATEATLEDLKAPRPDVGNITSIKSVAGEDYTKVNKGKITRSDTTLVLEYTVGKKTHTTTYPTR